jgi:hypothetical protein
LIEKSFYMWENFKVGLLLFALVIAFFLIAPHIPHYTQAFAKPLLAVEYATALQGRITDSEVSRQHYLYYLDNNTKQRYDFNAFIQPLTPAQKQMDEVEQNTLGLGQRLRKGDIVSKAANSTLLTVQRGDSTSRWFCATPQEIEKAQKAAHLWQ